jgi:hypothetical protein
MPAMSSLLLKPNQPRQLDGREIRLVGQIDVDGAIVAVFAFDADACPLLDNLCLPEDGLRVAGAVLIDVAWPDERPNDDLEYSALTPLRVAVDEEALMLAVEKGGPVSFRNFDYQPWD